ncbi:MAG: amidinotransferase [Flavobacteriales bacterium]|nr:amidinotransferase [Flavobacteriales bacterium]
MSQSASCVILVRPTGFRYDPETAVSNDFQQELASIEVREHAAEEFDGLLEALRQCGIGITVLDPIDLNAPNAVFPNNWFSTHADGRIALYPMFTQSRRAERDPDMAATLRREGFTTEEVLDISGWEHSGRILEGTGSLVLDRVHKRAFACLSPRTTESALIDWCDQFRYTPIAFTATMDGRINGAPVYHTNVMMSIGGSFAVVCFDAMPYPAERQEVEEELAKSGKEIIAISIVQMYKYVGNMIELKGKPAGQLSTDGLRSFTFLSETAFRALRPHQRVALERHTQLIPVAIPTIEAVGGGSVRCMLAENFLPKA